MPSIEDLDRQFSLSTIPVASKQKYQKEWEKFKEFLKKFNHEVSDAGLRAYLAHLNKNDVFSYSASSIASKASMLKKMCTANWIDIHPNTWKQVKTFTYNLNKNHQKKKSPVFRAEEVENFLQSLTRDPRDLIQGTACIVAFSGGIRYSENHQMQWKYLTFHENPNEIVIRLPKVKGNNEGRLFVVSKPEHVQMIRDYRDTFKKVAGGATADLYRSWSNLHRKWTSIRRGKHFFQELPRDVAKYNGKPNSDDYTHHSFRRTFATTLFENGATRQEIKHGGLWRSDGAVEGYIVNSVGHARHTAKLLTNGYNQPSLEKSPNRVKERLSVRENGPTLKRKVQETAERPIKLRVVLKKPKEQEEEEKKNCVYNNCTFYMK